MAYWAATELAGEFPQPILGQELISASTSPVNWGGLGSYIAQVSAEFDGTVAGAGYVAPIPVTASSYPYAQMVVGMGARALALEEIYGGDNSKTARLRAAYLEALERISDKTLVLLAPVDSTFGGKLSRYGLNTEPQIIASMGMARIGRHHDF